MLLVVEQLQVFLPHSPIHELELTSQTRQQHQVAFKMTSSTDHSTSQLPSMPQQYEKAIELIDDAHAQDPNLIDGPDGPKTLPYELHYARKMTRWLARRRADASPLLQVACRAQHFRRYGPL